MPDYSKGKIYKVVDFEMTKCYIGSTVQPLCSRMATHRDHYRKYVNGKSLIWASVFRLFDEFGLKNCKIVLVENYPCNSKEELEGREGEYQKNTECVNKYTAGKNPEEQKLENSNRQKQQRIDNPEKVREYDRQAYYKRKEHKNRPYICECGATVCFRVRLRHFKSLKHQQYLQNFNNPQE